jgi:DNA-binding GntR family transcriptional regulator
VLKGIESKLRDRKTAVYALIERDYRIPIERVEQDLQGIVLEADDAANLGAKPGAPALRIVRRYYSEDGRLLEVADNIHPSDRFTYHMQLRK